MSLVHPQYHCPVCGGYDGLAGRMLPGHACKCPQPAFDDVEPDPAELAARRKYEQRS